jgi:formylmethanofuran dehydrogenase subunit B
LYKLKRLMTSAMAAHSEMAGAMHPAIQKFAAMAVVHVAMAVADAVGAAAVAGAVMHKAARNVNVWTGQTPLPAMQRQTKSVCPQKVAVVSRGRTARRAMTVEIGRVVAMSALKAASVTMCGKTLKHDLKALQ